MGAVCQKVENSQDHTQKGSRKRRNISTKISQSLAIPGIELILEHTAHNLRSDCLLVFVDPRAQITQNKVLKLYGEHVPAKIKEFMEVRETTAQAKNVGQCEVFPVAVRNFPFSYIAILFIKMWEGDEQDASIPLQEYLVNAFWTISEKKISSLVVSQFNEQFGLPWNRSHKALALSALQTHEKFDLLIILCRSENSQSNISQLMGKYRLKTSFESMESTRKAGSSVYY